MARRIAGPTINWAAIAERVHELERPSYLAFKARSDQYLRRMQANPESFPKLDWAYYKKNVAVAGMVDKFQKEFDALKIPYPEDKYTSAVDNQEKEALAEVKQFIAESNKRIESYQEELAKIKNLLPYEQMTMEDFHDAHPDLALNTKERPTFWPHTEETQLTEEERKNPF
ncbi:ATP synthase subunit d, mitochondrial [Athalia rosae]|uniref:ATP synthase subunit d, mitochondrial n=1 Tax=Athalia rosae TaxID=37344 RepID=UPI00203446F5|nr:ATP synthase subunit d, mitochondrial [Athalia rosae]